ncbi:hypothetical protein SAMN04487980_10403 [Streptomyces sp. cf124]|uniref:hypothetical protein n=1 Tax=Streptomyces sp. cf124 TaxID=1761903 RepID=UPI0008E01D26|nr:hypothetical protein [Streptomyces sp. cf124]SFN95307.1 hypothetical protein SAMN04487980_10403 [Streptomyces sp. cf124]
MYRFKKGLYEFLQGVHRRRLAGRILMDPGKLSRVVNKNQRITRADLDRLIAAVQTSERTPPTLEEIVRLRGLHVHAEREADREAYEIRGLRVDREQAVRRVVELEDLLKAAREELAQLRTRTEQALREDGEQAAEDTARLAALEARVRDLEQALADAVAAIIALEERLAGLEQRLPDLADPTSMPALADNPLRAAHVLAAIPDTSERIATAGRLVPELDVPSGVLMFFAELLHRAGAEALTPVMEESLPTMAVADLAAVLVAASSGDVGPGDEDADIDTLLALLAAAASGDLSTEDEETDEDGLAADLRALLHDLVPKRLEARSFAALVHLLSADDHHVLATALLASGAQGPVHDVLKVSDAMRGLAAPYLEEATTVRHPEGIAELTTALRTADRDPDARTVLHTAGRRLGHSELAKLTDLLRTSGRTHDLRELQEGTALRDTEG